MKHNVDGSMYLEESEEKEVLQLVSSLEEMAQGSEDPEKANAAIWKIDYLAPFCGEYTTKLKREFKRKRIPDMREWKHIIFKETHAIRTRLVVWKNMSQFRKEENER